MDGNKLEEETNKRQDDNRQNNDRRGKETGQDKDRKRQVETRHVDKMLSKEKRQEMNEGETS